MKTVAVEDLIISTVLTFCENAAELGCPRDKEVDMWFRELSYQEAFKVAEKMIEIEEKYCDTTSISDILKNKKKKVKKQK